MKIHEYQAKELFRAHGLPVPDGRVAATAEEAVEAAREIGPPVVIKAQVHAGGRGKAGGIRIAAGLDEAREAAESILGMSLTTSQTGGQGTGVERVLVEQAADIAEEMYLSILPDRTSGRLLIICSRHGGMDIEEIADRDPGAIVRIPVQPLAGVQPFQLRRAGFALGLAGQKMQAFCRILGTLFQLVVKKDLLLLEINPLVYTKGSEWLLLDAKVEVDGNGLIRQPALASLHDPGEDDPLEVEAREHNLNYIRLDGTVGNMVNGAGLAMATMDLIKRAGAEPANFLDVGGGADSTMIENGFRILLADPRVKVIFINIFGGILRCDILARGVVSAANSLGLDVPVVVRMEGTNVDEGRRILAESGLDLEPAKDLADAAEKISRIVAAGS